MRFGRRAAEMTEQTIWYEVADLTDPADEPYMVLRIDTAARRENGVEGTVVSLHWTRQEAQTAAQKLTDGLRRSEQRR